MEKNTYKKQGANGEELAEEIGKGLNIEHSIKVQESRNNNTVLQIRLPESLKESFEEVCEKPSETIRSLMRLYVIQSKKDYSIKTKTVNPL